MHELDVRHRADAELKQKPPVSENLVLEEDLLDDLRRCADEVCASQRGGTPINIKSQIKRNKTNEKGRERNRAVKSELRTRAKNAVAAVGTETEEATLRLAVKRIDMAASKGIIHKNQAANKKSGLMKRIAKLSAEANA